MFWFSFSVVVKYNFSPICLLSDTLLFLFPLSHEWIKQHISFLETSLGFLKLTQWRALFYQYLKWCKSSQFPCEGFLGKKNMLCSFLPANLSRFLFFVVVFFLVKCLVVSKVCFIGSSLFQRVSDLKTKQRRGIFLLVCSLWGIDEILDHRGRFQWLPKFPSTVTLLPWHPLRLSLYCSSSYSEMWYFTAFRATALHSSGVVPFFLSALDLTI